MKKVIIAITVVIILCCGLYWGWNEYNISRLQNNLKNAEEGLEESSNESTMLTSFSLISTTYNKTFLSSMPVFSSKYNSINAQRKSYL